ncbi:MAG: hypothetical protein WCH03_03225 [Flavobacteriia bacterium]
MKKLYFLSILLLSISFAQAQRINYDISSKWFFGLNAGVTWNSTDVKNVNSSGYGLILGRSYNYNYGKKISFDLRGRYLTGTWVGQDTSVTPLSNYQGGPLDSYNIDSNSIYVNNFQTDVRRLALELVLHMNGIREKTGIDPYVFGGIGLTWTQTYGDLLYTNDSSSLYDYTALQQAGPIGPQLPSTLDGLYETRLDGGSNNQYKVKWMPSLGFGLGYQVGKRTSLGIEHKTTFTKGDSFDGFISESPRLKNDWHHYTSAYLRINFKSRGGNTSENTSSNVNNYTSTSNCPKPVLTLTSGNNKTVTNNQYRIEFKVSNLLNSNGVTLLNDQNQPVLFDFNASTNVVSALVQLHVGQNNFSLTASNSCGSETATVFVNFLNCVTPTATFTNPNGGNMTVKTNDFAFSAVVLGSVNANGIKLLMNGMALNGATYNQANGLIQRAITLVPGVNTLQLTVTNDCGTNTYTTTINYDNCVPVSLQLLNPSASGTTTNSANYTISATLTGSLANVQLKIFQNGLSLPNVTVSANGQIQVPTTLSPGINTFNIEVSNGCGNDVELTTINYQNCNAPTISVQSPLQNQSLTATANAIRLKSIVSNVATKQNIKVIVNGIEQSDFTFNATTGAIELGLNPVNGNNSITITATNNCGSDVETIQFNYINCTGITPNVTVLSAGGTVNSSIYNLIASTLSSTLVGSTSTTNNPTNQTITVTQNGSPIAFNQAAGIINAVTTLIPGMNTFVVTVTSVSCGSDSKTITVNYNNCIAPQITLIQPTTTGGTTNLGTLGFKASATNIAQSQNIQLVKNGQQIPFTFANGIIDANITLTNGINTITLSVNNACGNDAETFTVNYVQCIPPTIQLNSSIASGTTVTNANYPFSANVLGATSLNMSLKLNGVSTSFNNGNNAVTAALVLSPGLNTIIFNASNDCGVDVETITVNYDNCIAPAISNFSNNVSSVVSVANATQTLTATIANATTQNTVFTQNGIQRPFTLVNGQFSATVNPVSGVNSFVLTVSNNCGTDQHNWNIQFTPCTAPTIAITNPSNSGTSVNAASFAFQANVQNMTSSQGILLSLNGTSLSNFSFNNGTVSANLNLQNGLNTIVLKATNACGTDIKTITIFYTNCTAPVVTISSPANVNGTVATAGYTFTAAIQNITTTQGLLLSLNGSSITNYTFTNGQLSASVNLASGMNTFVINATNACGTDMKSLTLNYLNCIAPIVQISNPLSNNLSVTNAAYTFQANVQHMSSLQGISLQLNGMAVSNATLNNGVISANVNLNAGINTFVLSAVNACGTDSKTATINYQACTAPQVTITNPLNTNYGVSNPVITFAANVTNMSSVQGILLTLNGSPISAFNYTNGQVTANITLSNGMNTISLSATNNCGNDAQSRVIRYEPCVAPVVTINNPSGTNYTATSNSISFAASVQNMTNAQGLSLTVNGVPVSNVQFNPTTGLVSATIPLSTGNNSIVLSANGACGSESKTVNVAYNPCVPPVVNISNPSSNSITVSSSNYAFTANVQNATLPQISLSVNGTNVSNFNLLNGNISANVNLSNGNNEIKVTVNNACGTDTKTVYIKFEECLAPVVNISNPITSNTSVTNASYNFTGTVQNIGNGQGINLTLNGNIIPNASFTNGQISAVLTLTNGLNQIVLSAVNSCGTDSQTTSITFNQCIPPVVSIQNPLNLFYGVNSPVFPFQATIINMPNTQGISLTVAGSLVSNFNLVNNNFTSTITLPEGVNEIVLTATNACGTSTQSRTIRYQSCIPPLVNVTTDPSSGSTTNSTNLNYTATVTNYAPSTAIQLMFNGAYLTNFINLNGTISANLTLTPGNNEVILTATSSCGSDSKSYLITFDDGSPNGGSGNSDGMMQQNQPTQNKTNGQQSGQAPTIPAKPAPATVKPTVTPTPVKPTAAPTPVKPTVAPTPPPPVKPTTSTPAPSAKPTASPTTPSSTKETPTTGGGNKPSTGQQSPQNETNPTKPKGETTQKGGGK